MSEAKSTRHAGTEWSTDDIGQLRDLAAANTPVRVISIRLGRSEDSVRSKAHSEGISLTPPNRRPYGDMS